MTPASTPPLKIGLTGGIASGKSAVADAFARRGVPVIDTDVLAREVVESGQPVLAAVVAAFGPGVLGADGRLDRRGLRALVFADESRRRTLESILHPAIRAEMQARAAAVTAPYVVIAIPLLVENGLESQVDRVLVVDCDPAVQLRRLLVRDGETESGARAILAAQASRERRLAVAHDVLRNEGTLEELDAAVAVLHDRYLALAADRGSGEPTPLFLLAAQDADRRADEARDGGVAGDADERSVEGGTDGAGGGGDGGGGGGD